MEFVQVLFPTSRRVRIDGSLRGFTNRTLQVSAGSHRFTLDGDDDYAPPFREEAVSGTTMVFPLMVQFAPLEAFAEAATLDAAAPEAAPPRRTAAKKKRKKPAAKKRKPAKRAKKRAKKPSKKPAGKPKSAKRPAKKKKARK